VLYLFGSFGKKKKKKKKNIHDASACNQNQRRGVVCLQESQAHVDKTPQDKTRHDKTRQDKTRQDKTRHDTTRHDTTRQDKTRQEMEQTHEFVQNVSRAKQCFSTWAHRGFCIKGLIDWNGTKMVLK
jgi:hypothetical protein